MRDVRNLQQIMKDVSHRLDHAPVFSRFGGVLDELQAFTQLDGLLADLRRQYLNTKTDRQNAEREFGPNDFMTDVAMVAEDSAWCAMQTRLIELRCDRALMAQAQKLMEDSRIEEERLLKKDKEREALVTYEWMQLYARMRAVNENDELNVWLFLWLFSGRGQSMLFHALYTRSQFRLAA